MSRRLIMSTLILLSLGSIIALVTPSIAVHAQATQADSTRLLSSPATEIGEASHGADVMGRNSDQFDRALGTYRDTITLLQILLTVFALFFGIIYFVVPHQRLKSYEERIRTVETRLDELRQNVDRARIEAQDFAVAFSYYALGVAGALQGDDQTKRSAFTNFVFCMKTTTALPRSVYLKQLYAGSLGFIESMRHLHWTSMNQTVVTELKLVLDAMVSRLGWGNDAEIMLKIASVQEWLRRPTAATADRATGDSGL